ncbi:MAG: hypothetical protein QOK42_71 [Frankiaceae bacterium]|nr:hypothetical protein [Frankiaceae bacterium]MDX6274002.1 hypothetical protein [Frankiales bacterium]
MDLQFSGEIFEWRGPSPYFFVSVPDEECGAIEAVANEVTYGWGVIPVSAQLGSTQWTTSLFPKEGGYLVPLKDKVRAAEGLELGDVVSMRLTVDV